MIGAGRLNKRVIIQSPSIARNNHGEALTTWATVTTVWGSVEPISAKEVAVAQTFKGEVSHKVTIRYRAGVLPTYRLSVGGRPFTINGIVDDKERHESLEIFCTEVV
jgi:SPP1 family predicted phage head-tail adaptor